MYPRTQTVTISEVKWRPLNKALADSVERFIPQHYLCHPRFAPDPQFGWYTLLTHHRIIRQRRMTYQRLLSSYILDGHNLFRLGGRSRKPHHNSTCHSAQCSSVARLHTYNSWYIRISSSVLLSQVVHILLSALPFAAKRMWEEKTAMKQPHSFPRGCSAYRWRHYFLYSRSLLENSLNTYSTRLLTPLFHLVTRVSSLSLALLLSYRRLRCVYKALS